MRRHNETYGEQVLAAQLQARGAFFDLKRPFKSDFFAKESTVALDGFAVE